MKRIMGFCLLFTLLPLLFSCTATGEYRNDVSVRELTEGVHSLWEGYTDDTSALLEEHLTLDENVREHALLYRNETSSLDEIGFFRLRGGDANALAVKLQQDYLWQTYDKNSAFYNSYIPEETPKLENAEVRVFGNYVVYAILSEADKATLFRFVEETLRA